jgi:hypothetical protein
LDGAILLSASDGRKGASRWRLAVADSRVRDTPTNMPEKLTAPGSQERATSKGSTTYKRVALAGAAAFVSANLWTGCPLLALWIGSVVVGGETLSMTAVFVVVIALALLVFPAAACLTRLNVAYDELTGRSRGDTRPPWLRSMGSKTEGPSSLKTDSSALEKIVVINVYVAVIVFAIWYVFFAGPPVP